MPLVLLCVPRCEHVPQICHLCVGWRVISCWELLVSCPFFCFATLCHPQMPNPYLDNLNTLDSDTDDEDEEFVQALYLIAPDVLDHIRRNRRSQTRLYLTRSELLIHPQGRTPWQALYHSNNDRAFITTMGLDVRTFHLLLESGFRESWETQPIVRADANSHG